MSGVLSYLSKHPRDSQGIFGEDQRRSPTDRKCKKSLSSTFFCEICPSGVHGMWFAKFTCASHLAASVEGCWIGMLAFLQTLALSSGPQGHSFSHFITIAVDVAFQTWSARPMQGVFGLPTATATDEKMWQRNPALLSLRPLFLPISPSRCFAPGDAFGISAEPSCQVPCRILQRMSSWGFGCGKWRWEATPLGRIVTASTNCFLWVKYGQISFGSFLVPSGEDTKNYGKSSFSMGKSTINGHFQ